MSINPDIENEQRWPLQDFFHIKSMCVHLYRNYGLCNYKLFCWNNIATHVHDHILTRNVWSRKLSPNVQSFDVERIHKYIGHRSSLYTKTRIHFIKDWHILLEVTIDILISTSSLEVVFHKMITYLLRSTTFSSSQIKQMTISVCITWIS